MNHRHYLLEALKLAQQGKGFCSPNPAVGAVLVRNDQIIASGHHEGPGLAHAEVVACAKVEGSLQDATLYVTLEPCCHWGRTPPCTNLIITRGIKAVYYAYQDPNPQVAGLGQKVLKEQGITCEQIDVEQVNDFYQSYHYWTQTKKPWVVAKLAISLDAKIADRLSRPVNISGQEAQIYTHECRQKADAILTSVKTIIQDNPALNVRLNDQIIAKRLYLLDSRLDLPLNAKIFTTTHKITIFHSSEESNKIQDLQNLGVECRNVTLTANHLDLMQILTQIGADGIQELWVEAGGKIFGSLTRQNLAQKSIVYIAPKLLGTEALSAFEAEENLFNCAKNIKWFNLGPDSVCEITW